MALAIRAGKRKAVDDDDLLDVVPRHFGAYANFLQGQSRISSQTGIPLSQISLRNWDSKSEEVARACRGWVAVAEAAVVALVLRLAYRGQWGDPAEVGRCRAKRECRVFSVMCAGGFSTRLDKSFIHRLRDSASGRGLNSRTME